MFPMFLTFTDWLVLGAILVLPLVFGAIYYRRVGTSLDQYFLS